MNGIRCTHTSDWWKNMTYCLSCGAEYSTDEADRVSNKNRVFTAEQLKYIEQRELEGR